MFIHFSVELFFLCAHYQHLDKILFFYFLVLPMTCVFTISERRICWRCTTN